MDVENRNLIHATAIAHRGRGLLILGASGTGKSTLALEMMAFGAELVSDDQVLLRVEAGRITADSPDRIRGLIEARGVGILNARAHGPVILALAADLGLAPDRRLPDHEKLDLLGCGLPLVRGAGRVHLAAVLMQYLAAGRWDGNGG
ncbi:HPr kinase/phosphorylase [Paracoccus sp. (in: a-proteobacteria)]|uniref:HPr kinase/phosphorylase n=1 Tax=Paracoccus sp. TaxID=267 RepID=UPI0039E2154B